MQDATDLLIIQYDMLTQMEIDFTHLVNESEHVSWEFIRKLSAFININPQPWQFDQLIFKVVAKASRDDTKVLLANYRNKIKNFLVLCQSHTHLFTNKTGVEVFDISFIRAISQADKIYKKLGWCFNFPNSFLYKCQHNPRRWYVKHQHLNEKAKYRHIVDIVEAYHENSEGLSGLDSDAYKSTAGVLVRLLKDWEQGLHHFSFDDAFAALENQLKVLDNYLRQYVSFGKVVPESADGFAVTQDIFDALLLRQIYELCNGNQFEEVTFPHFQSVFNLSEEDIGLHVLPRQFNRVYYLIHCVGSLLNLSRRKNWQKHIATRLGFPYANISKKWSEIAVPTTLANQSFKDSVDQIINSMKEKS